MPDYSQHVYGNVLGTFFTFAFTKVKAATANMAYDV